MLSVLIFVVFGLVFAYPIALDCKVCYTKNTKKFR